MIKTTIGAMAAMSALLITATAHAGVNDRPYYTNARVVCGDTGCFKVKPGCFAEMRPSGRGGVVAVVICNKRAGRR